MVRSFFLLFSKNLRMVVQDSIPPRRTVPDSVRTAAPVRRDVLVMAPADSVAQAFFGGEPAILRKFVPESTDHSVTVPAFRPAMLRMCPSMHIFGLPWRIVCRKLRPPIARWQSRE